MSECWPRVKLGDLLSRSMEMIEIEPKDKYHEVTARLWGKGIVLRGIVEGTTISSDKRNVAHKGQFIISRIDARHGSMGIIPDGLDGAVVTNDFPLYNVDARRLDPSFLNWICKTKVFIELCRSASEGTTNRVRLKDERFLELTIPLPCIKEQREIVAYIDGQAEIINEAIDHHRKACIGTQSLMDALVERTFQGLEQLEKKPLAELTTKIGSGSTPTGGRASYPSSGVPFIRSMNVRMRNFQSEGIAHISEETHREMSGTRIQPNDVLLNITGASIGRVACVPPSLKEGNVNQHVAIIRPDSNLDSRFLMYWLSRPTIQTYIDNQQKGATRQGFTKTQIETMLIPEIPITRQRECSSFLDELMQKIDIGISYQNEISDGLNALLPSILNREFYG